MKLINPSFEDLTTAYANPVLLGERCARVCYKSENLIKDGSAKRILTAVADSGHGAMLEHIPVYIHFFDQYINTESEEFCNELAMIATSNYSRTTCASSLVYVSTNLRVVYETSRKMFEEFLDNDGGKFFYKNVPAKNEGFDDAPQYYTRRITIIFNMDRIGSQSFCRHRVMSFAQESTRWCNYLKEKFGSEISISTPCWLKEDDIEEFKRDMELYEDLYFKWLKKGYKAEEARYFLPFGLHTEIIMTGFPDQWAGFFVLRNDPVHAHSQAVELAAPLEDYFKSTYNLSR